MNHITLKIKTIYEELDAAERKIADYMLEDLDQIFTASIKKLSEQTETSQAGWVRFCKKLGYTGLKELKKDYILNVKGQVEDHTTKTDVVYTDIQGYKDVEQIISHVSELNASAISDTRLMLDVKSVNEATEAIASAKRIVFLGIGASGLVAFDAANKFLRIGKVSQSFFDFHTQLMMMSLLDEDDVAVFISYSGKTKEMVECMQIAKQRECQTICITKYGSNPLSQDADIVLNVSSPEVEHRSGATGSRIASLNVIDILFTAVANMCYDEVCDTLNETAIFNESHKV